MTDDAADDVTEQKDAPDPELEKLRADAAETAALRDQLAGLTSDLKDALRTANPDLPDIAFAGDSPDALKAGVAQARQVADHIKQNLPATPPPSTATASGHPPPGGGTTRSTEPTEGLRGADRLRVALNNRR